MIILNKKENVISESVEPDSNQRPKDYYRIDIIAADACSYSPPLYQLSYRRLSYMQ